MPSLYPDFSRLMRSRWLMVAGLLFSLLWSGAGVAATFDDARTAAILGNSGALLRILDQGIAVNSTDEHGNPLLVLAAREGQAESVKALLQRGAAIDYQNPAGDSALMLAVLGGHEEVVKVLLRAGARVNHGGWTAIHYAAFGGHETLLAELLAAGADLNARTPNQATPLMLAARNGHLRVVRHLLAQPATDLNALSETGLSADAWALQNRNSDIARLIAEERERRGLPAPALEVTID